MKKNKRTITELIKKEALDYAMYTIVSRAIPHMMDGFKPVHRYFMYSAIAGGNGFQKVASVGGAVSAYGYHHGEGSAEDAGSLLAADWCNNLPLFERDGFFGSRLVQKPGEARYIKCKVSPLFKAIYQDLDLSPVHLDPEHVPPEHYLPIIPMVLVNGFSGIAKAYATNIPPHCPASVTKACIDIVSGKQDIKLDLKYPHFRGTAENGVITGLYDLKSKSKLEIDEIPPRFDRVKYLAVLEALKEKGVVSSYRDLSKKSFKFVITLSREYASKVTPAKILDDFKLTENANPNINAIHNGRLCSYDTAEDLLKDFVKYRSEFYQKRIDSRIAAARLDLEKAIAKMAFIKAMLKQPDALKGKSRAQAIEWVKEIPDCGEYPEMLVSMNIYHLTVDEVEKLGQERDRCLKELDYWEFTNVETEYIKDLKDLQKKLK